MFFRTKHTPSGSVLQLLEAYRNGEGLPRQRVVVSLGNANLPKSLRRIVARAIEMKLYPQGGDLAGLEPQWSSEARHWIDNIYRRIVRDGRWSPLIAPGATPSPPADEGVINGVIAQEIEHTHSVSLGPILVARAGWETLGMPQLLCDLGLNRAQRDAAAVSVINRLVEPLSEHALIEWIPTSALPEIYGEAILQGGWNRYYRVSDLLLKKQEMIEAHLRKRQGEHFGLERTILLYDLTNTYFEGNGKKNPKAKRGKSKEKRDDCLQVVVGMVFDQEGFELAHRTFEGNQSDAKSLVTMVESLQAAVREGPQPTLAASQRPLVIVDAGVATAKNLRVLREAGFDYLVNDSRRGRKRWAAEFAQEETFAVLEGREQKPAVAVRLLETAEGERVVLCKSDGRKQKEQAIYSGAEKRFVAAMEKLDQRLRVGGVKDLGKAQQRVGKLLGRHPRVQRFYTVRLHEAEKPRSGLFYQRNESRYEEDSELFGCYVLRTARKDLDAGQLWKLYMRLSQAEEGFCALKSDLGLRPNFHQKEKRVDAHIFITVLAYHVWKWMVHTLRQAGDLRDWVTVRRVLQTHCYATVQLKTREGKVYHLRKPGIAETRQEELYKLFRVRVEGLPKSQQVVEADMKMKL